MSAYINGKHIIADKYGNVFTGYFDLINPICRGDIKYAKFYKSEEQAQSELSMIEERYDVCGALKVYRINATYIDVEENRESELFKIQNKLDEVYKIANNSLYFADSADYKRDLWAILIALNPKADNDNFKLRYIEE